MVKRKDIPRTINNDFNFNDKLRLLKKTYLEDYCSSLNCMDYSKF